MKVIALLLAILGVTQHLQNCSGHKTIAGHNRIRKTVPEKSGVISGNKTGILVSHDWIHKYKAFEAKHETIPEDGLIYMEGEQYRIPQKVADHFNDMVRAEPAPAKP